MSLFRVFKYSAVLFFFNKYRLRIFRVAAVLLFAAISSMLYGDVVAYLEQRHPDTLIYALIGKIIIVYGALAFVLFQFRPLQEDTTASIDNNKQANKTAATQADKNAAVDRLDKLADVEHHEQLKSRYDTLLDKKREP